MYISPEGLAYFIVFFVVFCSVVAVAVYLVLTLKNLNNFIQRIDKLVEANTDHLNKTLAELPDTMKNVHNITASVKENVDKAGTVIDTVEEVVCDTIVTVSESTESAFDFMKSAGGVVKFVSGLFQSKDK